MSDGSAILMEHFSEYGKSQYWGTFLPQFNEQHVSFSSCFSVHAIKKHLTPFEHRKTIFDVFFKFGINDRGADQPHKDPFPEVHRFFFKIRGKK